MQIDELYTKVRNELKSGNLSRLTLQVFTPNGGAPIELIGQSAIILDEKAIVDLPDDVALGHYFQNYYYLRKHGEQTWSFIGMSNESESSWQVQLNRTMLSGAGIYAVKGLMVGEYKNKYYFGEDEIRFSVVDSSSKGIADQTVTCSATVHIKNGCAVVLLDTNFGLPSGTKIPLCRQHGEIAIDVGGHDLKNGHAII